MTSSPASGISDLPDEVCGVILALALAPDRDEIWRRAAAAALGGRSGEACRTALAEMAAQGHVERAQTISGLLRRVAAPVPEGIGDVHPSWLRAALEGESTEVLVAVVRGMPEAVGAVAREIVEGRGEVWGAWGIEDGLEDGDGVGELRRGIFAGFVGGPRRGTEGRFAGMRTAELLDWVGREGASKLGVSLAGAPAAVVARAAAGAGQGAELVIAEARGQVEAGDRARAQRIVALAASVRVEGTLAATQIVGLVSLARELRGALPSVVRAVAQRLPIALGRILLDQQARVADMIQPG